MSLHVVSPLAQDLQYSYKQFVTLVIGAGASKLGLRTTVAIVATRLLIIPLIGVAVVLTAEKMGFLPVGNLIFKFVLLLQHTMPSSILAGSFSSLSPIPVISHFTIVKNIYKASTEKDIFRVVSRTFFRS